MKPFLPASAILFSLAFLTGCAFSPDNSSSGVHLTGDLSAPLQIDVNQFVRRQPPHIFVKPIQRVTKRPRALIVPFRMVQSLNNPIAFADQVTRQFWNVWLSLGACQELEYEPAAGPYDSRRALALARQRGVDIVIGGYIQHYIDGGDGGESTVSLQIEVHDVRSGVMLWSMAQGGLMESRRSNDFYLVKVNQRLHGDPTGFIVRSLAWDMGREVLFWINPGARHMDGVSGPSKHGSAF